jgi:hypothetical protein
MKQAALSKCLLFDPFSLFDDGGCSAEVGVCGRYVVQTFVIALVVIMFDERLDLISYRTKSISSFL